MLTATGLELWSPDTASFVVARRLRTLGLFDSSVAGFASVVADLVASSTAGLASSDFSSVFASSLAASGLATSSVDGFTYSVFSAVATGVSVTADVASAPFSSATGALTLEGSVPSALVLAGATSFAG